MNLLRNSLRSSTRRFPRTTLNTQAAQRAVANLPRLQQRYASYQRFPGKGGNDPFKAYSNFRPYAKAQYVWRNYRNGVLILGGLGLGFYVVNLEEVPITGRRRFNVVSPEFEKSLVTDAAYQQTLQEFQGRVLPREHPYTQLVAKVTERLLPYAHSLDAGDWKIHVIDDPKNMNAFVMPGGKVFVFTGLLPIAQDENGLAAVLGHEIAHNVAHHVGERLSRQLFTLSAAFLVSLLFDVSGQFGASIANLAFSLPNGRTQESEADHIGLLMMAEACYDPRRAPDLWKRMAAYEQSHGGAPPQFLSTHPSSSNRGEAMQKWMPEALDKYEQSECSITARGFNEFQKLADIGRRSPGSMSVLTGSSSRVSTNDDDWPF